ncbi:hypothetical protein OU792_14255 [Algoriphagus sp. NF]|jgi:hypothetical protein|uniref:hypothetical protein n=1 Tax=Algoriphagus sp. NF TaxID=2992756 RepID=UPI001066B7D9|nr:hypothetical protein [Algoriphagus sp. NF]MDE0561159.1 hypothetical protein [Algoriphagus sp. NF]
MHIPNTQNIDFTTFEELLKKSKKENLDFQYNQKKHQLELGMQNKWFAKIFLPWDHNWQNDQLVLQSKSAIALVGIRAGQAFTGLIENRQLIDHKIFRAYMVRKKQGKSQVKHLKTKGKSRAGSRIRLAETERFFNEINERLEVYAGQVAVDRWGIACGKTLWPYLFDAEVSPPFSKKDSNLVQLPFHVQQASFEELQAISELLMGFHLLLSDEGEDFFEETLQKPKKDLGTEDDW